MIQRCTFEGCLKSVELPAVFLFPPEGWMWVEAREPGVRNGLYSNPMGRRWRLSF
jgi:hypothetical protein